MAASSSPSAGPQPGASAKLGRGNLRGAGLVPGLGVWIMNNASRLMVALGCLAATALPGCASLPPGLVAEVGSGLAGTTTGGGPVLKGMVQPPAGADATKLRVALLGSLKPGAPQEELVSAPSTAGAYTLTLPAQPAVKFLEAPAEDRSVVFSLVAYTDTNGNGRYDPKEDALHEATTASGTFRYFAADGPSGTYRAGWNLYKNGSYTQGFESLAFNVATA